MGLGRRCEAIAEWYFPLNASLSLGVEGFRPSAVTFATGWQTAYWVAKHRASAEKLYFVQDFEPDLLARGIKALAP
ncbi:hypothetical protein DPM13_15130 [Paracoccus mutanolyticus]|uniref:Uncharacterized protein n=1 Tax=Paracoccus mutanolyticus TaxID=1499308 RepID=A0ABN5M7G0_9RHOB|nr:hypothetical protein [Paracoccus mutanolyticus]AWX93896.1 hypothetical protein DPM13_15130 [Paracoccus mutanolyticus]